ncbi:MAG: hypothetical protein AAF414_00215 [Pseudomonadota bacterium]
MRLSHILALILIPVLAACQSTPSEPQLPTIDEFYGYWEGETTSVSDGPPRAAFVLIEDEPDDGIMLRWRNVSVGLDGSIIQREGNLDFVANEAGWSAINEPPGVGAVAVFDEGILTVTLIGIDDDGRVERQVYDRTILPGDMLRVIYNRFVDGELRRTIEAVYRRTTEPGSV